MMTTEQFISRKRCKKSKPIGQRIFRNLSFLKSVCRTKSTNKLHHILSTANKEELLSIVEICVNILCGRFSLTSRQKERLQPHAEYIRKLGNRKSESGVRKLIQTGGGIVSLIPSLILPVVVEATRQLLHLDG